MKCVILDGGGGAGIRTLEGLAPLPVVYMRFF